MGKWGIFITIFAVLMVVSLLRGSKSRPSMIGLETCGNLDWTIYFCFWIFVFVITGFSAVYLKRLYKRKVALNY